MSHATASASYRAILRDCARCDGKGERLTDGAAGPRQWQICFACEGTGCVLPQHRAEHGMRRK